MHEEHCVLLHSCFSLLVCKTLSLSLVPRESYTFWYFSILLTVFFLFSSAHYHTFQDVKWVCWRRKCNKTGIKWARSLPFANPLLQHESFQTASQSREWSEVSSGDLLWEVNSEWMLYRVAVHPAILVFTERRAKFQELVSGPMMVT